VVISFLSERNAIQVTAILDFYGFSDIPRVWYPVQVPRVSFFKEKTSLHCTPLMPCYPRMFNLIFLFLLKKKMRFQVKNNQFGLFYALGQVAVKIVNNSAISDGLELYIETEFGAIRSSSVGQFYLLPMMYWVNQTKLKYFLK